MRLFTLIGSKNIIQWIPVIRTPLGVGKYVLITGINYTVDMRTVLQKMVLISGVLIPGIHCIQLN